MVIVNLELFTALLHVFHTENRMSSKRLIRGFYFRGFQLSCWRQSAARSSIRQRIDSVDLSDFVENALVERIAVDEEIVGRAGTP